MENESGVVRVTKIDQIQRRRNRAALVKQYEGNYDRMIMEAAQDVAPQLLDNLVEMAEGTQWRVDEYGQYELDEDGRRIPVGDRIPKTLQRNAINDVLGMATKKKDPLEALAELAAGGGGGFNITINHFGTKETADEVARAIHAKVENAKVINDGDSGSK